MFGCVSVKSAMATTISAHTYVTLEMERTEQCGIPSQADWHSAHFLGNSYNFSEEENAWALSCATYVKECVLRIESEFELDGDLWMHHTPLP